MLNRLLISARGINFFSYYFMNNKVNYKLLCRGIRGIFTMRSIEKLLSFQGVGCLFDERCMHICDQIS